MVTYAGNVAEGQEQPLECYCVADDTKPTTWNDVTGSGSTEAIPNGSFCYEIDTKTAYWFDAEGKVWY